METKLRHRLTRVLNVVDEFTREALAGTVARHLTAKDTVAALEQIVTDGGAQTAAQIEALRDTPHRITGAKVQ